jgi:hypothetical protein
MVGLIGLIGLIRFCVYLFVFVWVPILFTIADILFGDGVLIGLYWSMRD